MPVPRLPPEIWINIVDKFVEVETYYGTQDLRSSCRNLRLVSKDVCEAANIHYFSSMRLSADPSRWLGQYKKVAESRHAKHMKRLSMHLGHFHCDTHWNQARVFEATNMLVKFRNIKHLEIRSHSKRPEISFQYLCLKLVMDRTLLPSLDSVSVTTGDLRWLVASTGPGELASSFARLKTLVISGLERPMPDFLNAAINVQDLTLHGGMHPIHVPDFLSPRLRILRIHSLSVSGLGLCALFKSCKGFLASLSIQRIQITDGWWQDIFQAIQKAEHLRSLSAHYLSYPGSGETYSSKLWYLQGPEAKEGVIKVGGYLTLHSPHWLDYHALADLLRTIESREGGHVILQTPKGHQAVVAGLCSYEEAVIDPSTLGVSVFPAVSQSPEDEQSVLADQLSPI